MTASYTHYAYLGGPSVGFREPTALIDLSGWNNYRKRKLIHTLLKNGELLASIPTPFGVKASSMMELRAVLKWLEGGGK